MNKILFFFKYHIIVGTIAVGPVVNLHLPHIKSEHFFPFSMNDNLPTFYDTGYFEFGMIIEHRTFEPACSFYGVGSEYSALGIVTDYDEDYSNINYYHHSLKKESKHKK